MIYLPIEIRELLLLFEPTLMLKMDDSYWISKIREYDSKFTIKPFIECQRKGVSISWNILGYLCRLDGMISIGYDPKYGRIEVSLGMSYDGAIITDIIYSFMNSESSSCPTDDDTSYEEEDDDLDDYTYTIYCTHSEYKQFEIAYDIHQNTDDHDDVSSSLPMRHIYLSLDRWMWRYGIL